MRIAATCKHLQRDIDEYRHLFDEHDLELIVPAIPGQELAGQDLIDAMDGVVGVIAGDDKFTSDVLDALPDLKAVSKWGIGLDGVDLAHAAERNVTVTNTPGMFNDEVAEIALGYLIASVRGIVATDRAVRRGEWRNPVGRSLGGKHVVVIGVGNIGLAFARKALALGMKVSGVEPGAAAAATAEEAGVTIGDIDELFASADIVVVTCPLNPATQGLIDADRLGRLPQGSHLINVGRGPVVINQAVADALSSGHLAGAALDVFEEEPLPADSSLRDFDNCILGTHNSSNTLEACHRTHAASIANLFTSLGIA